MNLFARERLTNLDSKAVSKALPKPNRKSLNPHVNIILDNKYQSTDIDSLVRILKKDFTNWGIPIAEKNDCDDFAFRLFVNLKKKYSLLSFGVAISANHAFNIFVDKDGTAWIVEPQTDKIMAINLPSKYKSLRCILI